MNRIEASWIWLALLGGLLLAGHVGGHLTGQVHLEVGGEPRPATAELRSSTRVLLVALVERRDGGDHQELGRPPVGRGAEVVGREHRRHLVQAGDEGVDGAPVGGAESRGGRHRHDRHLALGLSSR